MLFFLGSGQSNKSDNLDWWLVQLVLSKGCVENITSSIVVSGSVAAKMCLPWCCLAMAASIFSTLLAFSHHVTIYSYNKKQEASTAILWSFINEMLNDELELPCLESCGPSSYMCPVRVLPQEFLKFF